MNYRILLALSLLGFANGSFAQNNFTDGFEGASLDPFWTTTTVMGTVTMPSTAVVHSGLQSLQLDTGPYNPSSAGKYAICSHSFAAPQYGTVSVWMYDPIATAASSNYIALSAGPIWVGTFDYNLTPTNGGSYVYSTGASSIHTTVPKSPGWHQFTISSTRSSATITIDGTVVYSGSVNLPISEIQLRMSAPQWRPSWTCYFDDFTWSAVGQGQTNSPCASLTVNGVGSGGTGPFFVNSPAGGNLNLSWLGSPNQPLLLLASSGLAPGQNFGGSLIIDLNLSSLGIVFSGIDPVFGSLFFTGSQGTATQTLSVPSSAAGVTLYMQGVVYDQASSCSGGIGLMTTASFAVRF